MPERKISRRDFLKVATVAGLGLGGVALAGCKGETSSTESAPTKVAQPNPDKFNPTTVPSATPKPSATPEITTPTPEATLTPKAPEKPAWLAKVSNAEAKFNPNKKAWEYYSTAEGEQGQYVCSVKQNEKGEYFFYSFAEELRPGLHPELFVKASWVEMRQSGAVKFLFCDMGKVNLLKVHRSDKSNDVPLALLVYFKVDSYPVCIYYPYLKKSQANPSTPRTTIYLDDINPDLMDPVGLNTFDPMGKIREIENDENLIGQTGIMAEPGTRVLMLKKGYLALTGRGGERYNNDFNRMLLDTFARDSHGRLMVPREE